MANANLYELTNDMLMLQEMLQDALDDPDMDQEDLQVYFDTMEGTEEELRIKLDGYGCVISNKEISIAAKKAALDKMQERLDMLKADIKREETQVSRMKDAILGTVKAFFPSFDRKGNQKGYECKTANFNFKVAKNPASVNVKVGVDALPEQFVKTKIEKTPDKTAIKNWLQAQIKENPEFTCDFASLVQGERINF